jgi:drug/metabolite transporter (DMT)-like permease
MTDAVGRKKLRNRIFITLIVISNTLGNLSLGRGMKTMPGFRPDMLPTYIVEFATNPWIAAGIALLIVWMVAQLSMFTFADLTYVLPMTAGAYVLTAVLSRFFLGEQISPERWAGIALISVGVMLVSESPPVEPRRGVSP